MSGDPITVDSQHFRQVLGHFASGITVVAGLTDDGPVGLAVASFCSVSLTPPLVGVFADQGSRSWPRIEATGAFCVSVLGDDQEDVCRRFGSKEPDKFAGIGWEAAPTGSPRVSGALAWIDCRIHSVSPAGDHSGILGQVVALGVADEGSPLIVFRGGFTRLGS